MAGRVTRTGPISLSEIGAVHEKGTHLQPYRGKRVLNTNDVPIDLPFNNLSFSDFYGTRIKPSEEYPQPVISGGLPENMAGFYNTGDFQVNPQISIDFKNEDWPQYRPQPTTRTTIQWSKFDGSSYVDLAGETNEILTLDPIESNDGTYKVRIKAELIAANDSELPLGGADIVVAQDAQEYFTTIDFKEFTVTAPLVRSSKVFHTNSVEVRQYENDVNGNPIEDAESDVYNATFSYEVDFIIGTNYGKPFDVLPTATGKFQISSDNVNWTDLANTEFDVFKNKTKDIVYSGTNPMKRSFNTVGETTYPAQAIRRHVGTAELNLDDFLDTNYNDYYIRLFINAHCNYENSGTSPGDTTTFATNHGSNSNQLDIVLNFVQRNNTPPDVPALYKTFVPKAGSATFDATSICGDADGDTLILTGASYSGSSGNMSFSGNNITFDLTGDPNADGEFNVNYSISDQSTRPGGPGTGSGVLRFLTSNQPPVAGDVEYYGEWAGPGTGEVKTYTFNLTRLSSDPNGDAVTLVKPTFTTLTGCKSFSFSSSSITLTLNTGFSGDIVFEFDVKDALGNICLEPATATIHIQKTNLPPFINNGTRDVALKYDSQGNPAFSEDHVNVINVMSASDYEGDFFGVSSVNGSPNGPNGARVYADPIRGSYVYIDVTDLNPGDTFAVTIGFTAGTGNKTEKFGTLTVNVIAGCPTISIGSINAGALINNRLHNLRSLLEANIDTFGYDPFELTRWDLTGPGNTTGTTPTGPAYYNPGGGIGNWNIEFAVRSACGSTTSNYNIYGTLFKPNAAPICNDISRTGTNGKDYSVSKHTLGSDPDGDNFWIEIVTTKTGNGYTKPVGGIDIGDPPPAGSGYVSYLGFSRPPQYSDGYYKATTYKCQYRLVDEHGAKSGICELKVSWPERKIRPEYRLSLSNTNFYTEGEPIVIKTEIRTSSRTHDPFNKPLTLNIIGVDDSGNPDATAQAKLDIHTGGVNSLSKTFTSADVTYGEIKTIEWKIPTTFSGIRTGNARFKVEGPTGSGSEWRSSYNYAFSLMADQNSILNFSNIPTSIRMNEGETLSIGPLIATNLYESGQNVDWHWTAIDSDTGDLCDFISPNTGTFRMDPNVANDRYEGSFSITAPETDLDFNDRQGRLRIYNESGPPTGAIYPALRNIPLTVLNNDLVQVPTINNIYFANRLTEDGPVNESLLRCVAVLDNDGSVSGLGTTQPIGGVLRWSNLNDNTGFVIQTRNEQIAEAYGTVVDSYGRNFIHPIGGGAEINPVFTGFGNRFTLAIEVVPPLGEWRLQYPYYKFAKQTLNVIGICEYRMVYTNDTSYASNWAQATLEVHASVGNSLGGTSFRGV